MSQEGLPAIGDPAPDFTLSDASGQSVSLGEFTGQWLVLYFYPKANTQGCTVEALEFTALLDQFAARGAVVLGVSPDAPTALTRFADKHALRVRFLSDADHKVCEAYGVWREKTMCGRKYFGVVRSSVLIDPAGKVAKVWPKAKSSGHAAQVLAAIPA